MAKNGTKRKASKRTANADGPLVVYIHGIGAQLPKEQLKLEWDMALFGRAMGERTRMAYWADVLRPPATDASLRAERVRRVEPRVDVRKALDDANVETNVDDAERFADELLRSIGVVPVPGNGPGKRVLPLPGFLRRPISRVFLEAFVGDTAAYFFEPKARREIRRRFLEALPPPGHPCVVVAHSQGTIIAFDLLREEPATRDLPLFLTLGSPLGIQEVQDHLGKPIAVPQCALTWFNASDPLDPVALDHGLANDFARNDKDVAIRDLALQNGQTRVALDFNPHSAVGYLAHPKVRDAVCRAAQIDPMGRFVVARDVADHLGSATRVPVLIEVLEPGYGAVDEGKKATRDFEENVEGGDVSLERRVQRLADHLLARVPKKEHGEARVDRLKRFVAARLTPEELRNVAECHSDWRVYAVWRSTRKRKLIHRSAAVLHAPAAQTSYGANGAKITWAVLDTGVRQDHPHFSGVNGTPTIKAVYDCTKPGPPKRLKPKDDQDVDGHGTHVCGIIAGRSPTTEKVQRAGLAPNAELVVYKVLEDDGSGEDAWIIKALDHISEQNENNAHLAIHGVNLSLGGPFDSTVYGCGFSPICVELRRLWRQGVVVCVAAGNEGQLSIDTSDGEFDLHTQISIGDPANLEDCIAVGSVNADKPHLYGISSFSSRGPTADGRLKPDVVAPGERITSCNARFRRQASGFSELYYTESGTSMATPHVSGLLAAFLSVRREFIGRPDEVKKILLDACTDLGRDRYHQGHGMPNLMKMLLDV